MSFSQRLATILNKVYSGGVASAAGIAAVFVSNLGLFGTLAALAGLPASPRLLVFVVMASLAASCSLFLFAPIRWSFLPWLLRRNLTALGRPDLLVGVGPGGAIVAGMICKIMAKSQGHEPVIYILDRLFDTDGRRTKPKLVALADLDRGSVRDLDNVWVVTSEVHTGGTLLAASDLLRAKHIPHKLFAVIAAPTAQVRPHHVLVHSDTSGLLPWDDSPDR